MSWTISLDVSRLEGLLFDYRWPVILGCSAVGLSAYILWRPRNLPPGPMGWPLVGYAPHLSEYISQDFTRLGKMYGDVFSFKYGSRLVLVLNSHEAVKEAFVRQAEHFSDKPPEFNRVMQLNDEVFIPPYHDECRKNKKMASSILRKVGLGSGPQCDALVSPQVRDLVEYIRAQGPSPIDADQIVYKLTGRIELRALFGKHVEFDDPELKHFTDIIAEWNKLTFGEGAVLSQLPTLTGFGFHNKFRKQISRVSKKVRDFVRAEIKRHLEKFSKPQNIIGANFVDHLIAEKGVNYDLDALTGTCMIFTPDTTDTLALSLKWILLYVTIYPEVQTAIQTEIFEAIGSAYPSLTDRSRTPYTEAVILEVLRVNPVFGTSFAHSTPWDRDIQFWGYTIPKRTFVFANIYGINYSAKMFPDPHIFRPERFLDADGRLYNADKVMSFSSGKRMCMGEQQARALQYLFITNFLQNFRLTFPDDRPQPTPKHVFAGMATEMEPFHIVASPRETPEK